ncbi:hypothetical protein AMC90_CH02795 [Rhizobium phaseoli]|uniref:hypothetical protein n=1 Tax=Rhizobium phaseoli TaxID=396 RepID=UPI0007E96FD6|nr:hypothetical protein [Rhizobium phaseoli]ANL28597.1 hypothetical protein AMC90_CH02795 [Rhizobium phaseoli]
MQDFQPILDSAFPASTFSNTVRGINEGLALGDETINGVPFMDTPVGKDIRGLIRRAAVMFRLHELCQIGDLPFITAFSQMPVGSWHWLEIRSGACHGYLVRTGDKDAFPEDTPNQQDKRYTNQIDLFDDPKVVRLPAPKFYTAWLCYGASRNGALTHALWGLPSGSQNETWLARRDVLNGHRYQVSSADGTKTGSVDPRRAMKFRDEVKQMLDAQKEKKGSEIGENE